MRKIFILVLLLLGMVNVASAEDRYILQDSTGRIKVHPTLGPNDDEIVESLVEPTLTGKWYFTNVLSAPHSTTLPASCTNGDMYIDTNATSGQQLYVCETGGWVAQGGAAASGDITAVGDCTTGAALDGGCGTTITIGTGDVADAGVIRLQNNVAINWEASPAGTDVGISVDASEVVQISGAVTASGLITASAGITSTAGTTTLGTVAGAIDAGGATSVEIPNAASPTIDAAGEIGLDTTANQLLYYGSAVQVVPTVMTKCGMYENLVGADDNMLFNTFERASTVTGVSCRDSGFSTHPVIQFEDDSGNSIGAPTSVTCDATTGTAYTAVSASNTFVAGEAIRFDNTSSSSPTTGTQALVCIKYTEDRQ